MKKKQKYSHPKNICFFFIQTYIGIKKRNQFRKTHGHEYCNYPSGISSKKHTHK